MEIKHSVYTANIKSLRKQTNGVVNIAAKMHIDTIGTTFENSWINP